MHKLLIVEDDEFVLDVYKFKLGVGGCDVQVASDGEAALKVVRMFQPDLVLLDLMLPKLNGVDVIRRLRASAETRSLLVLVLTNSYLSTLIQDAWKAGASKCLSKTDSSPKVVAEIVREMLAVRPAQSGTRALASTLAAMGKAGHDPHVHPGRTS